MGWNRPDTRRVVGGEAGDLACAGLQVGASAAREAGARGTRDDPVRASRDTVAGVRTDDRLTVVVPPPSQRDAVAAEVKVGREGRVVALVRLAEADDGTLLLDSYEACEGEL